MILLDTDVLLEPLRPAPDPAVAAWLDAQHVETLYLAAPGAAEIQRGRARLPRGKRAEALRHEFERRVLPLFMGHVLPFDTAAADAYAAVMMRAAAAGHALCAIDGCIAAIATAHGLAIATRHPARFEAAGLAAVDPWHAAA